MRVEINKSIAQDYKVLSSQCIDSNFTQRTEVENEPDHAVAHFDDDYKYSPPEYDVPDNEYFYMKARNKKLESNPRTYRIYYPTNSSVREVSKKVFVNAKGKTICLNGEVYKIIGLSSKHEANKVKKNLQSFYGQSLPSVIRGMKTIITGLGVVGKASDLVNSQFTNVALDMTCFLLDLTRMMQDSFSFLNLISMLINFYKVVNGLNGFVGQGLDACIFSAASLFMPKDVFEVLKRINVFSNVKFLDDPSMLYSLLDYILSFVDIVISKLPIGDDFKKSISEYFNSFRDYGVYFKFKKVLLMAEKVTAQPRLATDSGFRLTFRVYNKELEDSPQYLEWVKRSNSLSEGRAKIKRVEKIFASYENALRVEPSCFVFEGKPGTLKSVLMNNVVSSLREAVYYHNIKSVMDGKDWYDSYNNEPIFVMDDVGQQGISQWRTIINMVSPVKLPLDCAEASLKDTKFFNSDKILVTTNKFVNLTGLSKSDCIDEITALWRRAYVFYFDCKRVGGRLSGAIKFMHFTGNTSNVNLTSNPGMSNFAVGFPKDISDYALKLGLNIGSTAILSSDDEEQLIKVSAWMADIVQLISVVKEKQRSENDMSTCIDKIDKYRRFLGQGIDLYEDATADGDRLITSIFGHNAYTMSDSDSNSDEDSVDYNMYDDYFTSIENAVIPPNTPSVSPVLTLPDETNPKTKAGFMSYIGEIVKGMYEYIGKLAKTSYEAVKNFDIFSFRDPQIVICFAITFIVSIVATIYEQSRNARKGLFVGQVDLHPSLNHMAKQVFCMDIHNSDASIETHGLVSGHCIVLNSHSVLDDEVYVTIYKNKEVNHILYDHCKYKVLYRNNEDDVVVLRSTVNMATPFKNLSRHFKIKPIGVVNMAKTYLVNTEITPLHSIASSFKTTDSWTFKYKSGIPDFVGQLNADKDVFYKFQRPGACGSVIFDVDNGVLGMHSAGSSTIGIGAALFWSNETVNKISVILKEDNQFLLNEEISNKDIPNFSGIKIDKKVFLSTPSSSKIIPSPLYEAFPISRVPANLQVFGKHTIKDVAKKSFSAIGDVNNNEVEFAAKVIDCIIDQFSVISEEEIVKGNELLAALNKDSSNGYNTQKDKNVYIDFENKCFTPGFKEELEKLEQDIEKGDITLDDIMWVESLKDELRSVAKNGVPRSFRIARIHIQVLTKKYFGEFVANLMRTRKFHGISVGINPFKEWDKIYDSIGVARDKSWANDIKFWDGSMLAQVQTRVNEVLIGKYIGPNRVVAEFLLNCLVYTFVGVNDDVYMTNHSMPSGSFLTAIYNSLVNKFYKGMWYYRFSKKKTVSGFFSDIVDLVYGDDTLNACLTNDDNLNALTMLEFFNSIGLSCTTSTKGVIKEAYESFRDITFLKRSFRFHPKLNKVVCPLDLDTIYSSLSWYDSTKVMEDVLQDKMHSFQREMYLHYDIWKESVTKLEKECAQRNVQFVRLTESYIQSLYLNEPDEWKESSYSTSKYM
jgi:hypothetical protein